MLKLKKLFVIALMAVAGIASKAHAAEEMTFVTQGPRQPVAMWGNAWTIYADGPIDPGAPARLKQVLAANKVPPYSVVMLNSPGGNLYASLEMGRLIRKNYLFTEVMKRGETPVKRVTVHCHCPGLDGASRVAAQVRETSQAVRLRPPSWPRSQRGGPLANRGWAEGA